MTENRDPGINELGGFGSITHESTIRVDGGRSDNTTLSDFSEAPEPKFDRVVVVLVPASGRLTALAKGSAAMKHRDPRPPTPGDFSAADTFQMVEDFTGPAASTLQDTWGELPAATPITSDSGERLWKTALSQDDWDSPGAPRFYTEFGKAVTDLDTLTEHRETARAPDEDIWLVPALALQPQHYIARKPTRVDTCYTCHDKTVQFQGDRHAIHPELPGDAFPPIWICVQCGNGQ